MHTKTHAEKFIRGSILKLTINFVKNFSKYHIPYYTDGYNICNGYYINLLSKLLYKVILLFAMNCMLNDSILTHSIIEKKAPLGSHCTDPSGE